MGKIVVSQNVTLDGVVQDPTGEEGLASGGWFNDVSDSDRGAWAAIEYDEALRAGALLLGRRTDEWFGSRWNERTGEWADRLRALPKFVVSSGASAASWRNGTVISGELSTEVPALTAAIEGDIVVYGSAQLVHELLRLRLVDEIRLTVYPCVAGAGERLFPQGNAATPLRLVDTRAIGDALGYLTYECVRPA